MRIAVSGTHCCGKSTLIDKFLLAHPDYAHEPEPYYVLQEDHGEVFAAEPSADDFYRQLEFNASRLRCYQVGEKVIYERSPADFLAYLLVLNGLGWDRSASQLIERSLELVREACQFLDLIVFLPINQRDGHGMSDYEDPDLRREVNDQLKGLLIGDDFNLFALNQPVILEVEGTAEKRLRMVEAAAM